MPPHTWPVVGRALYVHHKSIEPLDPAPGEDEDMYWVEDVVITAPGVAAGVQFAAIALVWYALFLWVGLSLGFGIGGVGIWYGAMILALNATIRAALKSRERVGRDHNIKRPLGRENTSVRLIAVLVGAALGATAGYVLTQTTSLGAHPGAAVAVAVLTLWEALQNGVRVGGGKNFWLNG